MKSKHSFIIKLSFFIIFFAGLAYLFWPALQEDIRASRIGKVERHIEITSASLPETQESIDDEDDEFATELDPESPTADEDFLLKFQKLCKYIDSHPKVLEEKLDIATTYMSLSAFEKDQKRTREAIEALQKFHAEKLKTTPLCIPFFELSSAKQVDFKKLDKEVSDCAKDPRKRAVIVDYLMVLKREKGEEAAREKYHELNSVYPDLPSFEEI